MFGDTQRSVFLLKKNQAFWPHSQTHTDLLSHPVSKSDLQFSAIRNVRFFSSKKVKAAGLIPKHIQSCLPILFRNLTLAQTTTQREKNTFVLLEIFGRTDRRTDELMRCGLSSKTGREYCVPAPYKIFAKRDSEVQKSVTLSATSGSSSSYP